MPKPSLRRAGDERYEVPYVKSTIPTNYWCQDMNFSPIPKTAPFTEEEIEILNRVVGPASPTQRAWLAGFLAGVDAATMAPQPAVQRATR